MSTENGNISYPCAWRYPVLGNVNGAVIVSLPNGQNALIDVGLFIEACQAVLNDWSNSDQANDPDAEGYETLQKVRKALSELG